MPCAGLGIGRKHRRNSGERSFLIDQQHVELLAHQRLEVRQAACRREPARMRRTASNPRSSIAAARHARIEEPADDGFAQAADRNARLELGNPLLQQLADATGSWPPCATGASPAGSMPTAACSVGEPYTARNVRSARASLSVAPGIERSHDLPRDVLLHRDERIVRADGLSILANLLRQRGDRSHHRVCIGEQLVLQPQGMQLLHPLRQRELTSARTTGCANVR